MRVVAFGLLAVGLALGTVALVVPEGLTVPSDVTLKTTDRTAAAEHFERAPSARGALF